MFLTRVYRRALVSTAAKSEASASTALRNLLEELFEVDRNQDDEKPLVYGRSGKASELCLKSWDDLNKLWYVLLKEKNMLMSQRQMLHAQNLRFPNPERLPKVRKSMCRIKHVLTERAIEEPDPRRSAEMKKDDKCFMTSNFCSSVLSPTGFQWLLFCSASFHFPFISFC